VTIRETITPTCDVPLSVAVEELTGFEILGIQKRFGKTMDSMGGAEILMGTVWALENRDAKTKSWTAVESMTMRALSGYFPAEPEDPDTPLDGG
jgi:hypothetical protein